VRECAPVADVNTRFDAIVTALLSESTFGDFAPDACMEVFAAGVAGGGGAAW